MRRRGVHGLQQQAQAKERFNKVGAELQAQQVEQLRQQLATFKANLEDFASKHRKEIQRDPVFRAHFQKMCASIGVDPLASNKGFWSELLGVGDFYYELAVQITEICLSTRDRNGGLIDMVELKNSLDRMRGRNAVEVSDDDIQRSIKTLKTLGSGFEIITFGERKMIQSVPRELNSDFSIVLGLAQSTGFITIPSAAEKLQWDKDRVSRIVMGLLQNGICWVDEQTSPEPHRYWVISFYHYFST